MPSEGEFDLAKLKIFNLHAKKLGYLEAVV
jgi:hypothetical protein